MESPVAASAALPPPPASGAVGVPCCRRESSDHRRGAGAAPEEQEMGSPPRDGPHPGQDPAGIPRASVEPSCDVVKGRGAPGVGGSQHPGAFCLCLPGGCPGSPVPSGLEACCFLLSLVFLFSQADFFPPAASFGGRLMGTVRPGAVQVERGTSQDPGYS